ncbi:hypothetical protein RK21_01015 [Pseudomonas plecoglossicida]|uniref:Tetratricopeptide TPR_2 repeat protein n=1 Tax=Pseudomonas putida (strain W619) TaxID=390235 RepID=B1JB76_PSEPW|nr:hypothetical protein RK21_01015 [Pseudomonas plecoglossicida]
MKLKSFTLAGESFLMAGYHFAVKSAFRRARELTVSEEAKKTLYTLGRIHQEQGSFAEAQKYYEVVFTLSPDYLDVDARLQHLRRQGAQPEGLRPSDDKDWYANLILELLDPAAQRGFTPSTVRATQLAGVAEQRGRLLSVIAEFAQDKAADAADAALDYDVAAYMRYDCSVPEDEAKKSLELVNMLDCLPRPAATRPCWPDKASRPFASTWNPGRSSMPGRRPAARSIRTSTKATPGRCRSKALSSTSLPA